MYGNRAQTKFARGRAQWKPRRKCSGAAGRDPSITKTSPLRHLPKSQRLYNRITSRNAKDWKERESVLTHTHTCHIFRALPDCRTWGIKSLIAFELAQRSSAEHRHIRRVPGFIFLDYFGFGISPNFVRGFSSLARAVSGALRSSTVGKKVDPVSCTTPNRPPPRSKAEARKQVVRSSSVHSSSCPKFQCSLIELSEVPVFTHQVVHVPAFTHQLRLFV